MHAPDCCKEKPAKEKPQKKRGRRQLPDHLPHPPSDRLPRTSRVRATAFPTPHHPLPTSVARRRRATLPMLPVVLLLVNISAQPILLAIYLRLLFVRQIAAVLLAIRANL